MNHMVTTADTNTDHGDNSNNVTTRSTIPFVPLEHDHSNGESPLADNLSFHTPKDGESAGQAVHLENQDQNNDDNMNVINNMIWITSANRPDHGELSTDDDTNDDDTNREKRN